jgi:hypothetical protein
MNQIVEIQEYDKSHIKDEALLKELDESIEQATRMLDNTVIDPEEVSAASIRFGSARDAVLNYSEDGSTEEEENAAYLDFMPLLADLFQLFSDLLFRYFGGAGFSDM